MIFSACLTFLFLFSICHCRHTHTGFESPSGEKIEPFDDGAGIIDPRGLKGSNAFDDGAGIIDPRGLKDTSKIEPFDDGAGIIDPRSLKGSSAFDDGAGIIDPRGLKDTSKIEPFDDGAGIIDPRTLKGSNAFDDGAGIIDPRTLKGSNAFDDGAGIIDPRGLKDTSKIEPFDDGTGIIDPRALKGSKAFDDGAGIIDPRVGKDSKAFDDGAEILKEIPEHWILASYADGTPIPGLAESRLNASLGMDRLIVNGENARKGAQPYMASLQIVNGGRAYHICGGHLSMPNKVITAAHCLDSWGRVPHVIALGYYQLSLGNRNPGSQMIEVVDAYVSRYYHEGDGFPNDIAVLTLRHDAELTSTVTTARMTSSLPPAFVGKKVTLTGWGRNGRTTDTVDILQYSEFTVIGIDECRRYWGRNILDQHICAMRPPAGSCQGDSGGPLMHNGFVVGVVSWGQKECDVKVPAIYNNPGYHKRWLIYHL